MQDTLILDRTPPPRSAPATRKVDAANRTRLIAGVGGILVLVIVAAGIYMMRRQAAPRALPEDSPPVAAATPELAPAPETDVKSMTDLTTDFEALQAQAEQANQRMAALLKQYQGRGGKLPPNFGPDLTDEQRTLLAERVQGERAGLRSLLQDIIDRDKSLQALKARAAEVEPRLPAHVTVSAGERHDRIVMDYLLKEGVPADKAYQLASQVNLQAEMVPGFTVWLYYQKGQFGTWVTKGTANLTPQEAAEQVQTLLRTERDKAVSNAQALQKVVDTTRGQVDEARKQVEAASAEAGALMKIAEDERAKNVENAAIENRMVYLVGVRKDLVARKIVTKDLGILDAERSQSIVLDLSSSRSIGMDATTMGLSRIKAVTLLPASFTRGTDYQVTVEGSIAQIRIMNPDKFKRSRIIIVLE